MITVKNSDELADAILLHPPNFRDQPISLLDFDYELDASIVNRSLHLEGAHVLGTKLKIFGTLKVRVGSVWKHLSVDLTNGVLNFDHAAHSLFAQVWMHITPTPNHYGKWWDDIAGQTKGTGIELTAANNGDTSWGVQFDGGCKWTGFEYAIRMFAPSEKGTVHWRFYDATFDCCNTIVKTEEDAKIKGWLFRVSSNQVCGQGYVVKAYDCRWNQMHGERSNQYFHLLPGSQSNLVEHDIVNANGETDFSRFLDEGTNTRLRPYITHKVGREYDENGNVRRGKPDDEDADI
jgi:hypothetical protein